MSPDGGGWPRTDAPERIPLEQVRLLHAQMRRVLSVYVVVVGVIAYEFAAAAPAWLLAGWWLAGALVAIGRYRVASGYVSDPGRGPPPARMLARLRIGAGLQGAILGGGVAWLMPYADAFGQAILLVPLAGLVAGALTSLAPDLRAYHYYTLAATLPVLLWFLGHLDARTGLLAIFAVAYVAYMFVAAERIHRTLLDALALRFENAELVDELRDNNRRLEQRAAFERVVSELSYDFVHLPVEEIDDGVRRALKTLGEHAGVDRAHVSVLGDEGRMERTHEWCAGGIRPEILGPHGLCLADCPWAAAKLRAQQDVRVARVADLPPEAAAEGIEWRRAGARSVLLVPMILGESVRGYLGYDAVMGEKDWTDDDVALLRLAGEIFVNALERRHAENLIHRQARYDDLTGLPNRRQFMEYLSRSIALGRRQNQQGAVLFVDLDRFKLINDSLGHGAGDVLLRETSRRLLLRLREYDVAARLGGDEFAVLLPQLAAGPDAAEAQARAVADKIRVALAVPLTVHGHELRVSASIGVALFPRDADIAEHVLESADVAMYEAKSAGRDAVRFFAPVMKASTVNRLRRQSELRGAAPRGELELYAQPLVDGNRRLAGAEGLLRWRHPERGLLGADEFIPLAEDTGLISELDTWALRAACRLLAGGPVGPAGAREFRLALNVSPATFRDADFIRRTAAILREHRIAPGVLEFEVTERMFLMGSEDAADKLAALRALGIRVSIDDFGVGYSSLAYLKHLPIDRVKVDKSFVKGVHANRNDSAIIEAIVGVAGSFGYEVIAEGVEDEADFDFLRLAGVWLFQGYLFGRPVPAESLLRPVAPAGPEQAATGARG